VNAVNTHGFQEIPKKNHWFAPSVKALIGTDQNEANAKIQYVALNKSFLQPFLFQSRN